MNNTTQLFILIGISLLSSNGFAKDKQNASPEKYLQTLNKQKNNIQKKTNPETKALKKIKYIPPFLGAPSTNRLSGMGVRSPDKQIVLLFSVLTPTHMGLTSVAQPNLFWFTSRPISESFQFIEFVLNSKESITPILRVNLPQLKKTGIHQLNIADHNIFLKPGIEYSWSISLIKNPQARSEDFVSSAKIKYVIPDEKLQHRLQQSSLGQKASVYAQTGYWYEAFATVIDQQKQQPDNLTQLIKQIELPKIAEYIVNKR